MTILDLRVRIRDLEKPETRTLAAPATSLETLAGAIGVDRVLSCSAVFHLAPLHKSIGVTGEVRATVVQTCGLSLEPFENKIVEAIDVRFAEEDASRAAKPPLSDEEEGSDGMADVPEPIVGGTIDLGALAQELLALGVDPYPRRPGAAFEAPSSPEIVTPFAALARLKRSENDPH